jgi:hypothetical protein
MQGGVGDIQGRIAESRKEVEVLKDRIKAKMWVFLPLPPCFFPCFFPPSRPLPSVLLSLPLASFCDYSHVVCALSRPKKGTG